MKSSKLLSFFFAIAAMLALAGSVSAQTNAFDDAALYTRQTWFTNRLSFGYGFTPWVLFFTNSTAGKSGFTIVNGGPIGSGNGTTNSAFGLFANSGSFNAVATAFRGFSNSLPVGNVFKLQWMTTGVGGAGSVGGFNLRNGNDTVNTNWIMDPNMRFAFYYAGGGSNSFSIYDGNSFNYISVPFASGNTHGLQCDFTLEGVDTYRFEVRQADTGNIVYIADSQPLGGSAGTTIDSFSLIDFDTTANQVFNHPEIVSGTLVPPTIVNVLPTNGATFLDATSTNVSFEVDTVTSTLATNGVTLLLNGVAQTNLLFNTNGPTQQLLVTNNTPLAPNTFYNITIIATDGNGNRITNSPTSFNTWLATDPYVEAEDYNFGGGSFLPNIFPDANDAYANLNGMNGIDYKIAATTNSNPYRPGDLPGLELAADIDHAGYAAGGYADYDLGFTDTGDWLDYTRVLDSSNYNVYARMAGFAANPVMELDRLASPSAATTSQPRAALGSFIVPPTGGTQIYTFVPLSDFFGNQVTVQFPGTNTFRATTIGGTRAYNFNYLIFVAITNATTLRPYISTGSPAVNATGIGLDAGISYSIANRQTAVNPATIQLFLNTTNITGSATISTNTAGVTVSYVPPSFLAPNTVYTVKSIFTDTGSTNVTNSWAFTTVNSSNIIIPIADAQPAGSGSTPGFALKIFKISDSAPTTATLANAEAELAGQLIDPGTSFPYPNLAPGANGDGTASETNEINYDITGNATGTPTFPYKTAFPNLAPAGTDNNFALQALTYLQLNAGGYVFAVRSDDGFKLTAGPTPANTNLLLGDFDGGRGNGSPTIMYVTVLTNGLYPMRLLYYQAGSGGNVEFYSLNNGTPILINDPTNANAIKAFQTLASAAAPVTLLHPAFNSGTVTFSFVTQSGHTHFVEYKNNLTDPSWTPLQTVPGSGSTTNISDATASGNARLYRVRTQ